jgi:cytidylate kinase
MINVEDVLRKQIALYRAYDIQADHGQRSGRGKEGDLSYGPYVLISHEMGAGGSEVGRLAGKRLGWQVFDKEIVDAIAKKAHVRRELIQSLDERDRTTIRDAIARVLKPGAIGRGTYLASLQEVLLALGHQGDVIIIGHGGGYVLPSRFGLRVRLVAPVVERVRRVAGRDKLSWEAAQEKIESSDRARAQFVRHSFGKDWAEPLSHDLIINTAELTAEAAADVVLTALQRKLAAAAQGLPPKTGT